MTKRICWKKGMRLTDDILRASDNSTMELVGNALALAAAGRFGLFPSVTPYELSLNINKGLVDVEQLSCLAVTKGGYLIDAHYDTKFTNTFDTRIQIPEVNGEKELILTIDASLDKWKDTNDGYEEPEYSFSLIVPNSPLPANSLPIARIVDEYGWRMDDVDFMPPCLYITSHQKYLELKKQFEEVLVAVDTKARNLLRSKGKEAIRIFWPVVQQLMITINKECDLMTPMDLLASVQKFVSAFTCACDLDDYINLADADKFRSFVYAPYNYKDAYLRIREGLELCFSINEKVGKLDEGQQTPSTIEAPTISDSQLIKRCTNSKARVQITNNVAGATVYYTVDGGEPTQSSKSGLMIQIDSGFNNSRKREPDKMVTVRVKAFLNGLFSNTNTYEITLQKDIERWTGIEI